MDLRESITNVESETWSGVLYKTWTPGQWVKASRAVCVPVENFKSCEKDSSLISLQGPLPRGSPRHLHAKVPNRQPSLLPCSPILHAASPTMCSCRCIQNEHVHGHLHMGVTYTLLWSRSSGAWLTPAAAGRSAAAWQRRSPSGWPWWDGEQHEGIQLVSHFAALPRLAHTHC